MISRNRSKYDEALTYYKQVVEKLPDSGYADDALLAIESIYQSKQEPEAYLAYVEGIGKSPARTDAERGQILFNGAEQVFLAGNYQKALTSLQEAILSMNGNNNT
jgi:tetratricopeptide (TPR) repeat protein